MTQEEQETILMIKGVISELPTAHHAACMDLVNNIRHMVKMAGEPVGPLAIALIGAEMQAGIEL